MAATAKALLASKGQTMQLVASTVGAYNPATATAAVTITEHNVMGVDLEMPAIGIGPEPVQRGDRKVIIEAGTVIPSTRDKIKIGGVPMAILDKRTISPAGIAVVHILHAREGG